MVHSPRKLRRKASISNKDSVDSVVTEQTETSQLDEEQQKEDHLLDEEAQHDNMPWPDHLLKKYRNENGELIIGCPDEPYYQFNSNSTSIPYLNQKIHASRKIVTETLKKQYNEDIEQILDDENVIYSAINSLRNCATTMNSVDSKFQALERQQNVIPLQSDMVMPLADRLIKQIGNPPQNANKYQMVKWIEKTVEKLKAKYSWYYTINQHLENPTSISNYLQIHRMIINTFIEKNKNVARLYKAAHIDQFLTKINMTRSNVPWDPDFLKYHVFPLARQKEYGESVDDVFDRISDYCDLMETWNGQRLEEVDVTKLSHTEVIEVTLQFQHRLLTSRIKNALSRFYRRHPDSLESISSKITDTTSPGYGKLDRKLKSIRSPSDAFELYRYLVQSVNTSDI